MSQLQWIARSTVCKFLAVLIIFIPLSVFSSEEFFVRSITISGSSVYQPKDFQPLYREYLGKLRSKNELHELVFSIENKYYEDGYIFVFVRMTNIKPATGHVFFEIEESDILNDKVIKDLQQTGYAYEHCKYLLLGERPLRREILDFCSNNYQLTSTLANQVNSRVYKTQTANDNTERGISGYWNIENRGSASRGRHMIKNKIEWDNPTPYINSVQLRSSNSITIDKYKSLSAKVEIPFFDQKSWMSLKGLVSRSNTKDFDQDTKEDSDRDSVTFELGREFTNNKISRFSLIGRFDAYASKKRDEAEVIRDDKIRKISINLKHKYKTSNTRHSISMKLNQGLNIFDAETFIPADFNDADRQQNFTTIEFKYYGQLSFFNRWKLTQRIDGQYADSSIPSSERKSFGGSRIGRGYDPSEISGDHGLGGITKISYQLNAIDYLPRMDFYSFYDHGVIWRKSHEISDRRRSLSSTGLGVEFKKRLVSGYLELAKPLTRVVDSRNDKDWLVFGKLQLNY